METLLYAAIGAAAGFLGASLGIGGGVIAVPALTLLLGLSAHQAVGTSLILITGISALSSFVYLRRNWTDLNLAFNLESTTILGAMAGAFIAGFLSSKLLTILFALLLFYTCFNMVKSSIRPKQNEQDMPGPVNYPKGLTASFFAGLASGSLGIGGGVLKVPIIHIIMKVPTKRTIATSSFMVGLTAATGGGVYLARGDVDPVLACPMVLGAVLGVLAGTQVSKRVKARWLRLGFALILLYAGANMLWKALV